MSHHDRQAIVPGRFSVKRLLYTFGIRLYDLGIALASLWNTKARLLRKGRMSTMRALASRHASTCVWFHAASLGEFEQARPLIEAMRKRENLFICVTFFSPSGYEVRKNYKHADLVCYLPSDTPRNVNRFLDELKPSVAFFIKYEFWFNYLAELNCRQISTYLVSGIFRRNQYFFKPYGRWAARHLHCFSHLFVQNNESVELLKMVGVTSASVVGDTRFDRVKAIAESAPANDKLADFCQDLPVFMAGSSWPEDERNIRYFFDHYAGELKFVIAPHEIDESRIEQVESLFAGETVRFSRYQFLPEQRQKRVLIVDTMGMLSSLYQYATVAYIGGGFGKGIHNILEALAYGKPVCFGPNYHKFAEACESLRRGCSFTYTEDIELCNKLCDWFNDPEQLLKTSSSSAQYVNDNIGATSAIISKIEF